MQLMFESQLSSFTCLDILTLYSVLCRQKREKRSSMLCEFIQRYYYVVFFSQLKRHFVIDCVTGFNYYNAMKGKNMKSISTNYPRFMSTTLKSEIFVIEFICSRTKFVEIISIRLEFFLRFFFQTYFYILEWWWCRPRRVSKE